MPVPRFVRVPARLPPVPRPLRHRTLRAILVVLIHTLVFAGPLSSQLSDADLREALSKALETIADLEQRVSQLEAANGEEDPLEAQLRRLMIPEDPPPPRRTLFPSSMNPRIGVYMDAVVEAGNAEEKLGEDGDRFSLREVEIDFRLPVSPFAEGVLITTFEDAGSGDFESSIEEGYADVSVGGLFDFESATMAKIGRFRVPFGHDNKLHTHDLMQVDRPLVISQQLGEEGLIGDGFEVSVPLSHNESEDGFGRTTTLSVAVVNGEMFTGDEGLLGELADDAGLSLDSDAPVIVARASSYIELDELSDLEIGMSYLENMASDAVTTDAGTDVEPRMYGLDVTWRDRDDESGVGSWLLQAEAVQSELRYGREAAPGFPTGSDTQRGYALTVQRQVSPTIHAGLRVGKTDKLGTDVDVKDITPYVTWYPDEFFRIRLQGQHIEEDPGHNANRVFLQFSWNFGAHSPHPYWTNR